MACRVHRAEEYRPLYSEGGWRSRVMEEVVGGYKGQRFDYLFIYPALD